MSGSPPISSFLIPWMRRRVRRVATTARSLLMPPLSTAQSVARATPCGPARLGRSPTTIYRASHLGRFWRSREPLGAAEASAAERDVESTADVTTEGREQAEAAGAEGRQCEARPGRV